MKLSNLYRGIEDWDQDPDFINTILTLNKMGFDTISSCAGHAPNTQYSDVQEWMDPYITFTGENTKEAVQLLSKGGFVHHVTNSPQKACASINRNTNWADVLQYLSQET